MRSYLFLVALLAAPFVRAQSLREARVYGIYGQWGYNRDKFSRSDIHFTNGGHYNFTIHKARAHDKPDFSGFRDSPIDITIPQNSCRIGLYLNAARTHAIELNFDHAKYVMEENQRAHLTGTFAGEPVDAQDTIISPSFLSFEHTNGANFLILNYVGQQPIWQGRKRTFATAVWKAGAGVVIPKTDVELMGVQLDNRYHVAGYIAAIEAGSRFYLTRALFAEATIKGGWANYRNVLTVEGGHASHHFWFGEVLGLVGYDLPFKKKGFGRIGGVPARPEAALE